MFQPDFWGILLALSIAFLLLVLLIEGNVADKVAAKRHNERLKLLATTANSIGLAILGAATILPNFNRTKDAVPIELPTVGAGVAAFFVLLAIAVMIYHLMVSED